ncbi:rhamnan synthesis F family protein [Paracoccus sp. S4493]|uniref:rhamnan synthesis F family protein n=1 Tax=Paracoccus sp. S4493 TaxID=579490 RepID=UPI0006965FC3|nr:rhamnan synthesis F family protein [Paracoccus sp. S4493]
MPRDTPDLTLPTHPDRPSDAFALIVHVWHLDTLDDLSAACENFPAEADRFVTFADSLSPEDCQRISDSFAGAQLVAVRNLGQDIGALMQLMDQVDLSRYSFVCKIHSKKGPKMPEAWRRTLLSGVLGSLPQVERIVTGFRNDPQVMLAGARQLFLYGPAYLEATGDDIRTLAEPMLEGFDLRNESWGFIAGRCFWIRTDILRRLKALKIKLEHDGEGDDIATVAVFERLFGLAVAASGGTVLLTDQRDDSALPQRISGFPTTLPRESMSITQTLSDLEAARSRFQRNRRLPKRRRVAVFASYSGDGTLPPQVRPYLEGLRSLVDHIVVVCDNNIGPVRRAALAGLADHVIAERHGEYDFGSYKRGVAWARQEGWLDEADDLILCNDSCFGPVGSFAPMFERMDARHLDFWGATDSREFHPHLQSFFVVLGWHVFQSQVFRGFLDGVTKQPNVQEVILKYEIGLTRTLEKAGFRWGAMVENCLEGVHPADPTYRNIAEHPIRAMEMGLPLVKAKALLQTQSNAEGIDRTLRWLHQNAPAIFEVAVADFSIGRFVDADQTGFSIIMPTRNRSWCISAAIGSALRQTHQNFELIIVDDGSDDDTAEVVRRDFGAQLDSGTIRYVKLDAPIGVCAARNVGLAHARHDWVAYLDSDNQLRPNFLSVMANSIIERPDRDCFYGQIIFVETGRVIGRPYLRKEMIGGNYIDLGVFVHRRSLVQRFGGFDLDLRRLVDWDLILRYTAHQEPVFLPRVFLDYSDDKEGQGSDRISVRESFLRAKVAVHSKHSPRPTVSTAILSYNHQEFIVEAIESALEQRGDFTHEILLADDGSSDGTARIMARYAARYPTRIRNISTGRNLGVSANYQHCFREAAGNSVAILEGDDYWIDPEKNARQADFLASHAEAGAVFSRIELFDMAKNSRRVLKRQDKLPPLLTGAHFTKDQNLNLIVNFSSMMFRRSILLGLPSSIYHPRLSEIALAFYLDRIGKIGFVDKVMGVYRLNPSSVWTGADQMGKLEQAIATRRGALAVARPVHHDIIRKRMLEKQQQLQVMKVQNPQTIIGQSI